MSQCESKYTISSLLVALQSKKLYTFRKFVGFSFKRVDIDTQHWFKVMGEKKLNPLPF